MGNRTDARPVEIDWIPLSREMPPQGEIVLLTGPSGTNRTPSFVLLGYFDESFRPSRGGPVRWLDIDNDALTDQGYVPTHWSPRPNLPAAPITRLRVTVSVDVAGEEMDRVLRSVSNFVSAQPKEGSVDTSRILVDSNGDTVGSVRFERIES